MTKNVIQKIRTDDHRFQTKVTRLREGVRDFESNRLSYSGKIE